MKTRQPTRPAHSSPGRAPTILLVSFTDKGLIKSKRRRDHGKKIAGRQALLNQLNYERRSDYRYPPSELFHADHGLGTTPQAILKNLDELTQRGETLSRSWILSVDPALYAVLLTELPKVERDEALEHMIDAFIKGAHAPYFESEMPIPYSTMRHEQPDRYGRPGTHFHITLPGGLEDHATGEYLNLAFIEPPLLQKMKGLARDAFIHELDARLGLEWRLQLPEFEATYAVLKPPPDAELDNLDAWFPRASEVFTPMSEPERDDLVLERLFAELGMNLSDWAPTPAPNILVDFDPFHIEEERAAALPDTFTESVIISELLTEGGETQIEKESSEPDFSLILERILIPPGALGIIVAHAQWRDPVHGPMEVRDLPIEVINLAEHLFAFWDHMDLSHALAGVESRLDERLVTLTAALQTDLQAGLQACYTAWQSTLVLDSQAQADGFLPGVPRVLLGDLSARPEPLPDLFWVSSKDPNIDYYFTLSLLEEDAYRLDALKRSTDNVGQQQVTVIPTEQVWDNLADSAQALWLVVTAMETDFAKNRDAAEQQWSHLFIEAERDLSDVEDDIAANNVSVNHAAASGLRASDVPHGEHVDEHWWENDEPDTQLNNDADANSVSANEDSTEDMEAEDDWEEIDDENTLMQDDDWEC